MRILPRTKFGNPILREKAHPVFKKVSVQFIQSMFYTMKRANGVGLAAPQVNKPWRLAVIEIKKTKTRPEIKPLEKTVIINPRILNRSKETVNDWEGCLSLPGIRGSVPRYKKITVEFTDNVGGKHTLRLTGFQARVFQHEIDHLDGVLYIDHMRDLKTLMTLDEFKKRVLKKGLKSK